MIIIAVLGIIIMIIGLLLNINARKLSVTKVNSQFGIRIVHISDLHFDTVLVNPAQIIKEICRQKPEIIVITGDLCSKVKYFERVLNFLDMLAYKCECDILITLGNHDNKIFLKENCTKEEYITALESVSPRVKVLENEHYIFKNILFGGIGDIKTNKEDYCAFSLKWNEISKKSNKKFIILTHNPDILINLQKMDNLEIVLAGHTHGGQIKTPLNIEFRFLKKDILPKKKIFYGEHVYNGNKLYITSGIGCTFLPMRLKSEAEIVIFN